jgi:hypothetical protein
MPTEQYIVGNPRDIPKGIRILEFQGQEWYEGDAFVRPEGMDEPDYQRLTDRGFIVKTGGPIG